MLRLPLRFAIRIMLLPGAVALIACQSGPNCDKACARVAGCAETDTCLSVCSESQNDAPWACLARGTGSACGASFTQCEWTSDELVSLGISDVNHLRDKNRLPALTVGAAAIVSDWEGTGTAMPGEGACVRIPAVNTGAGAAYDISAVVTSADAYVQVSNGYALSVDLAPGSAANLQFNNDCDGEDALLFFLTDGAPVGGDATFQVAFSDPNFGDTWSDSFSVTIAKTPAVLSLGSVTIADDGDHSGTANPGETVCLNVPLLNTGAHTANHVAAVITTTSPYAAIAAGEANVVDALTAGGTERLAFGYANSCPWFADLEVTLAAGTGGVTIPFEVGVTSAYGGSWALGFDLPVSN